MRSELKLALVVALLGSGCEAPARAASYGNRIGGGSSASVAGGDGTFASAAVAAFGAQPFDTYTIVPGRDYAAGTFVPAWGVTPVSGSIATHIGGDMYIGPGSSGPAFFHRVGSGVATGNFGGSPKWPETQAVCSQPWAIEIIAAMNPVDVASAGNPGTLYLAGWTGSDVAGAQRPTNGIGVTSPGRGTYGGFAGLVYRVGQLQVITDLSINAGGSLQETHQVTPFTVDTVAHRFLFYYDLSYAYVSVDGGAPIAVTDSTFGWPQGGAYVMTGVDAGGKDSSVGGYGMELYSIRVAISRWRY